MEYNFSDLKKKKVINVADGRDLGKITDFVFTYPDGEIKCVIATGKKTSFFTNSELVINFACIDKIGDDAILVRLFEKREEKKEKPPRECLDEEDF